jgi:hypothetical protein
MLVRNDRAALVQAGTGCAYLELLRLAALPALVIDVDKRVNARPPPAPAPDPTAGLGGLADGRGRAAGDNATGFNCSRWLAGCAVSLGGDLVPLTGLRLDNLTLSLRRAEALPADRGALRARQISTPAIDSARSQLDHRTPYMCRHRPTASRTKGVLAVQKPPQRYLCRGTDSLCKSGIKRLWCGAKRARGRPPGTLQLWGELRGSPALVALDEGARSLFLVLFSLIWRIAIGSSNGRAE